MASMIVSGRSASKQLLQKLLVPTRATYALTPRCNFTADTDAARSTGNNMVVDQRRPADIRLARRRSSDMFPSFSDVFDTLYRPRSLSQMLNLMDNPIASASRLMDRRGWDAREDDQGLYLRIDMPGLDKDDVKVTVDQNTLVIKGEAKDDASQEDDRDEEESGSRRRYTGRIDLPDRTYTTDQIRAEMNNGVLKVFVPKIKEEQRRDVVHVNIE